MIEKISIPRAFVFFGSVMLGFLRHVDSFGKKRRQTEDAFSPQ